MLRFITAKNGKWHTFLHKRNTKHPKYEKKLSLVKFEIYVSKTSPVFSHSLNFSLLFSIVQQNLQNKSLILCTVRSNYIKLKMMNVALAHFSNP